MSTKIKPTNDKTETNNGHYFTQCFSILRESGVKGYIKIIDKYGITTFVIGKKNMLVGRRIDDDFLTTFIDDIKKKIKLKRSIHSIKEAVEYSKSFPNHDVKIEDSATTKLLDKSEGDDIDE